MPSLASFQLTPPQDAREFEQLMITVIAYIQEWHAYLHDLGRNSMALMLLVQAPMGWWQFSVRIIKICLFQFR